MLDRIKKLFDEHKDRKAFFKIVGLYYPQTSDEYKLIDRAYQTAKDEFRFKIREDSSRYFEHLRCVTLILMLYMRCFDHEMIAAALLHDLVEDIPGWDEERVAKNFTPRVAQLVWWVTKPDIAKFGGDKEARNRVYHSNLAMAPREAIMIKLADRLHNLLTLWDSTEEKQGRKVRETQDFYLPLAEKHTLLIHELETSIDVLLAA